MKKTTSGMLVAAVIIAVLAGVFVFSGGKAGEAVYPFARLKGFVSRTVVARVRGAWNGAAAAAENRRLKRELSALGILRADLERLEAENVRLRSSLGYAAAVPGDWVYAPVISRGGGAVGDGERRLRLGRGAVNGVRVGAVVAVPEGVVGLVTEVTEHTSVVTTLADRSIQVHCEVEIAEGPRPRGVVAGGTGDNLDIRYLKNAAVLPPRSRVLTTGLGGVFPKGLEIGLVGEGGVEPSVDYLSLEAVFIRHEK